MSLCRLQVISPAGVDHDSDSGVLQMKPVPIRTSLLVVALGDTDLIKEPLKSVGFKWSPANKVWYVLDGVTPA